MKCEGEGVKDVAALLSQRGEVGTDSAEGLNAGDGMLSQDLLRWTNAVKHLIELYRHFKKVLSNADIPLPIKRPCRI